MFSAALLAINVGHALPLLLDVAVKGLAVSASALAALLCLRRASAATRHLALLAGLGVLLGLPVLMALLPRQELPRPAPAPRAALVSVPVAAPVPALSLPTASPVSQTSAAPLDAAPIAALPPLPTPSAPTPSKAPAPPIRPGWLVLGWLAGVLACAGRMLAAQARVWRLTRRCPPLPASLLPSATLETAPFAALLTGPSGTPPMVWGWPRPTLLLPPEAADWPAARRRAVVVHEAAHVRRCDWLTHLLAQTACALYWFNPLAWLLTARLGAEAERACDDSVLMSGVPATDYAQDLLAVARHLGAGRAARRASVGAVTMARRRSPVRGRLEAILDTRRVRRPATRRSAALALAAALAVAAPLASLRPAARADARRTGQAASTAGVPTEADIAKVQQHLQSLDKARAVYDYASAQPNMLTPAQTALVDRLIQQRELKRGYDNFEERLKADFKRGRAEAKKPHTKQEREQIWGPIFAYEHRPPSVIKRRHDFNASFAQLESEVNALPGEQVVRETRMYALDSQIALDSTRIEAMQMERDLGYSLHLSEDDITAMTDLGFSSEKAGQTSRADSVHVYLLFSKLERHNPIDDADIDALITILGEPSKTYWLAHDNVMSLFHRLPDASPAQRQKICKAVTPFLTSGDKWERKYAGAVLKKFGGSAPPMTQKSQAGAAALRSARPPSTPQAAQTGVSSMTLPKSIKPTLLRTAAFATLAAGLALPAAPAASPAPALKPTAPKPAAQASVAQAPVVGASHWASFLLRHTPLWKVRAFTGWDRGEALPEGVIGVYFLESNRSVLVRATPDGITHMQGIISRLDVGLRPIQLRVAFATVTAADLNASGLHSDEVPPDGLGATGKAPQLFMQGTEGSAVTAYLAALGKRKAVLVAPIITADINAPATISMEGTPLMPGSRSAQVLITPRLDKEGVLTLQMTPPHSARVDADGHALPPVQIVRTVSNGTTFVLANPLLPAAGEGDRYLLIFVTPTAMTAPDPATPPQMIP